MINAPHFEDTYRLRGLNQKYFYSRIPPQAPHKRILQYFLLCFGSASLHGSTCAQFANGSQSQLWNLARQENCFNIWQNFSSAAFKNLPLPYKVRLTWNLPQRIESNVTSLSMPVHPYEGSLSIQKPDNIRLEARCYPLISNPFAERTCVWGKSDRDILWFLILINSMEEMKEGRRGEHTLSLCPSVYKYTNTNGKMQLHKYKQDQVNCENPHCG